MSCKPRHLAFRHKACALVPTAFHWLCKLVEQHEVSGVNTCVSLFFTHCMGLSSVWALPACLLCVSLESRKLDYFMNHVDRFRVRTKTDHFAPGRTPSRPVAVPDAHLSVLLHSTTHTLSCLDYTGRSTRSYYFSGPSQEPQRTPFAISAVLAATIIW